MLWKFEQCLIISSTFSDLTGCKISEKSQQLWEKFINKIFYSLGFIVFVSAYVLLMAYTMKNINIYFPYIIYKNGDFFDNNAHFRKT